MNCRGEWKPSNGEKIRVGGSDARRPRGRTAPGLPGSARPGGDGERCPARPRRGRWRPVASSPTTVACPATRCGPSAGERPPTGTRRSLADRVRRRRGRPGGGGGHRAGRVGEQRPVASISDCSRDGRGKRRRVAEHGAVLSVVDRPRERRRERRDHLDHGGRRRGRPARHLLAVPRERPGGTGRRRVRVQLPEFERPDRGHVQRPGGPDELPRPEHLRRHGAGVGHCLRGRW